MDQDAITVLREYLSILGYDEVTCRIYEVLVQRGPSHISDVARRAEVERTKIYRLMKPLEESGLVEVGLEHKRRLLKATDVSNLLRVIRDREEELRRLREGFTSLERAVAEWQKFKPTRVQFYQGSSGIRQMMLHELDARTELLWISHSDFEAVVGTTWFAGWARDLADRGQTGRHLYSDSFVESLEWRDKQWFENVAHVQEAYISAEHLNVTCSIGIHNDVVSFCNWQNGEVFGVEIINQQVAEMQRSLFESAWAHATPQMAIQRAKLASS
jgi:sugar-specific transcriptional regulator TrmB